MREGIKQTLLLNLLEEFSWRWKHDKSQTKHNNINISHQFIFDPITATYSKDFFLEFVKKHLIKNEREKKANREKEDFAIIYVGIDNAKKLQQIYGIEEYVNTIVVGVAKILEKIFRRSDIIAHFDTDTFIIFAEIDAEKIFEIDKFFDSIQQRIEKHTTPYIPVEISYGLAVYPLDAKDIDKLLHLAKIRMKKQQQIKH